MNMQIFSSSLLYSFKFEVAILEQEFYILCTFNFIIMKCNLYVMFLAFFKNNNIIRS